MTNGKFIAGMRVAKVSGFSGHSCQEAFVDKVYRNGNFILKGDETRQQWRPYWDGDKARQVGETSRFATTVVIWDEQFDDQRAAIALRKAHVHRAHELERKVKAIRFEFLEPEQLSELEATVNKITTKEDVA